MVAGAQPPNVGSRLRGLYVILDAEVAGGRDLVAIGRQALAGGARVLQLRDKIHDKGEQLPVARRLKALCADRGATFLVNDHLDLAMACEADGVHVGQKDLPVAFARRLLPRPLIVGASTNNPREARGVVRDGADYVAVGRLFPTASKLNTRPATLDVLASVKRAVPVPVAGIGGITEENIDAVLAAGGDMVAVIGAVLAAGDVRLAAQRLARHFQHEGRKI